MKGQPSPGSISQVSLVQVIAYSLPNFATTFLVAPIVVIQGIYAKHFGLALTTIATVILVARLFDAITDPVIGYISDYCRSRTGTRKPIIVLGGILFIVSAYFLYIPPQQVNFFYLLVWFLSFYLAWTMFEIPHLAWGGELTKNSQEKTKIYSLRNLFGYFGSLLFFTLPLSPLFETNQFTPETLKWSVLIIVLIMAPFLYLCVKTVPDGYTIKTHKKEKLSTILYSIFKNKPLLIFLGAYFFWGVAVGMWYNLQFIFIDSYFGLGDKLAFFYLAAITAMIVSTWGWYRLSILLGKIQAWAIGVLLIAIAMGSYGLLQPGEANSIPLLISMVLGFIGFASVNVLAPSMLADIIDYAIWKFNIDCAGTYFSVFTLITKANLGLGGAFGFAVAGWFGFDAALSKHTEGSIFGLRLAIVYIPVVLIFVSMIFIMLFPMNTRRQEIIRRRLESRTVRTKATVC